MNTTKPAVFSPEAVACINRAYSEALHMIGAERACGDVRAKLAETMMDLARNGEMDERRLCSLSVARTLGR